jgi:rare lipoprotein A (peptidoglycan hydrolase)
MMRQILPAAMAAVIASTVPGLAAAKRGERGRAKRARSHVSLHVGRHAVLSGHRVALHGRVRPAGAHRVKVVVRGPNGAVARTSSGRGGAFTLRWTAPRSGNYRARAYTIHDRRVTASVSPARRLTAYHRAEASYYGPGLYGSGVACGGTLEPGTLGVAHKTLPCGTRVRLRYHGRSITVPVIDRGPYVAGRDLDLTEATRERLGFPGVDVLLSNR